MKLAGKTAPGDVGHSEHLSFYPFITFLDVKRKSVLVREDEILCYVVLDLLVLSSFVSSVVEWAKIE